MKQLLVMLLFLCSMSVSAQDVIVKKDGSTVVCRIVEVTSTEITYMKWSDLNGSNYVMDKSLAAAINYESGKKETFGEMENQYKPNNQNYGVQQYNDRALLRMNDQIEKEFKKVRTKQAIAWIGGTVIALGSAALFYVGWDKGMQGDGEMIGGGVCLAGSIVWTTYFLMSAHKLKQQYNSLQSLSLHYRNISISNSSSISLGADLLSDHTIGSNTLGLGLRYNF